MARRTVAFILSANRSGSTWAGYVLGSHPKSAFLGELYRLWDKELSRPCTYCAANGAAECSVLNGVEVLPCSEAFTSLFERTGKQLLVDNSKVIDWTKQCIGRDFEVRLIHLIRDPRGWFASERRRTPRDCVQAMQSWHEINASIWNFAKTSGHAYEIAFYDELALDPARGFRRLFGFCGLDFAPSSLQYWDVEHHCIAANGATSLTFHDNEERARVSHFSTGDDTFYAKRRETQFFDQRWKLDLDAQGIETITRDPMVKSLLSDFGRRMTPDGLEESGRFSWARRLRRRVGQLGRYPKTCSASV
jgi:hypothetical protein